MLYCIVVIVVCYRYGELKMNIKVTGSPWAVTLSWQHMTYQPSKTGHNDLVIGFHMIRNTRLYVQQLFVLFFSVFFVFFCALMYDFIIKKCDLCHHG